MPSARQYFYRSVKNILLIAAAILVAFVLALFLAWALPSDGPNVRIFFWYFYAKEIGIGISILVCLFFGYKAYLTWKTEKSVGREFLKMAPTIILWIGVVLYTANFFADRKDYDCQQYNYTDKLNGGIKEFQGKKYAVEICGSGINDRRFLGGDLMDAVELTITNEHGELVAKRRYKVFWDGRPGHEPLAIEANSITYQDDAEEVDHSITMPPTAFEWIRARIPLLN